MMTRKTWQEIWNAFPDEPCAICGATSLCWNMSDRVIGCYNPPTEATSGWRNLNHQHKSEASLFLKEEGVESLIEWGSDSGNPIEAAENCAKHARDSKKFFRAQKEAIRRVVIPAKPAKEKQPTREKKDKGVRSDNSEGLRGRLQPASTGCEAASVCVQSGGEHSTEPGTSVKGAVEKHHNEWVQGSAVDPEITALNVVSLEGQAPYERLFYSDQIKRLNTGRLPSWILKRYSHIEDGGWWASGIDPLTGEDELWGCFKPDKPRIDTTKGSYQKYEHPLKASATLFALRVPLQIWEKVSKRYSVPIPDDVEVNALGEALGFWAWVIANPKIAVTLTEGVKKAASLLSLGFAAIGLPGIWGGYRRNEGKPCLLPQLEIFAKGGRKFCFAFDQDEKRKTRHANRKALWCTAKLLKDKDCEAFIISWEPWIKGCDDLIVAKGGSHFNACYLKALSFDDWSADALRELTYQPALRLDSNSKYLGDFSPPPNAKLICLKAPKGSGKTEWLVKVCTEAQRNGQKVLVLTHRTQLGKALCNRFGIDYVEELKESDTKGVFGYGLCFDSLRRNSQARFNPDEWADAIVILDECEQSIWHLLSAKTEVSKHRVEVLRNFQQLIQTVLESDDGRVYLSDADLSDVAIDYLRSLVSFPVEPWVVLKEGNPTPWNVTAWSDAKEMLGVLEVRIRKGEKVLIFVDGRKAKSKWGTQNLEAYLAKIFPDKKILRVDAESVSNPNHAAYGCIEKLDVILKDYDIVIASPTIETGVSIDLKGHFTSVWDFAQGVIPVPSVLQRMARLREPVPRHVWSKSYGIGRIGNGSTSIRRLIAGQHTKFQTHIKQLAESDFVLDFDAVASFQPQSLRTWAKMAARINLGMVRYQHEIVRALIAEGHHIEMGDYNAEVSDDEEAKGTEEIKNLLTETRDKNYQKQCYAVAQSSNPDDTRLKALQQSKVKTDPDRLEQRKGELCRRYDESLVNMELVELDDDGEFGKAQLHYYLTTGREFLPARERDRTEKMLEAGEGEIFIPDANRNLIGGKIKFLEALKVTDLLQQGVEFTNESQVLVDLSIKARQYKDAIKSVLGLSFNFDKLNKKGEPVNISPVAIAQKFLRECLGLEFSTPVQRGPKGNQVRYYQPVEVPELRQKILSIWHERDTQAQAAKTAEQAATVAAQSDMGDLGVVPVDESSVPVNSMGNIYRSTDAVYQTAVYQSVERADARTDLERLVDALEVVGSLEEFSEVVGGREIGVVEDAIAFAPSQPRRQQLEQWLNQLSQPDECGGGQVAQSSNPPLSSYKPGDEVWGYFPQSEQKWLKATVEWVRGGMVRVISGFFGMHVERPELIAPGNWELVT
jgi:hypothetical protein